MPSGLRSLTVTGPTLALADAYATAGFAMGEAGIAWIGQRPGLGALGIIADERVVWTPLVDARLGPGAAG